MKIKEMQDSANLLQEELKRLYPIPTSRPRLYHYPKPLPDESFSSWAVRVSVEYSIPVKKFLLWCFGVDIFLDTIVDPDIRLPANLEMLLASMTGEDPSVFDGMFRITEHNLMRPSVDWLHHHLHYARIRSNFCIACLGTDVVPYFRNTWRYVARSTCSIHNVALTTACPHCDLPIAPIKHANVEKSNGKILGDCPFCRGCLHSEKKRHHAHSSSPFARPGLRTEFPTWKNSPKGESIQKLELPCIRLSDPAVLDDITTKLAILLQENSSANLDEDCFTKDGDEGEESEFGFEHPEPLWLAVLKQRS